MRHKDRDESSHFSILNNHEQDIDYQDLVCMMNNKNDLVFENYVPIKKEHDISWTLRELHQKLIEKRESKHSGYPPQSLCDTTNDIDPELRYRFLSRHNKKKLSLPQINSRLQWQVGEFPFFKLQVQYINQETVPYKNKRRINRSIKHFASYDKQTGIYHEIPFPEKEWPYTGTLFITNQRVFFKRTKAENFYICFDNILNYSFFKNGITIEHMTFNQKKIDAFYVDEEQARLLETVIHITL